MKKKTLWYLIRSDLKRRSEIDDARHIWPYFLTLIFNQPLFGVVLYRLGHFFYTKKLLILSKLTAMVSVNYCCMNIDYKADIGERLCVVHSFGVLIHGNVEMGDNVIIFQLVNIGIGPRKGMKPDDKVVIGDNTMIFAGAKVFGNLRIGKNAKVGANSVLLESIPDNAIAAGLPAKVIRIEKEA